MQREEERLAAAKASSARDAFISRSLAIHAEEICGEVDSLHALASCHRIGMQAGLEHLVPRPPRRESDLSPQETEAKLSRALEDLRTLRQGVADEYAKGISNQCITQ